jgi:formylmethanofuran dehydrogenase subunit B
MMVARIRAGRYVAIVADAEPLVSGLARDSGRAEALIALSFALNASARGALILLRGGGNRTGAEAVTTWQTGFPVAVDFSRGFPRYDPWTGSASARLSRGRIDAALIVGNASLLPRSLTAQLRGVATCTIGPRASEGPFAGGAAAIDTGVPGIHHAGLVLRMDDVPVPVRGGLTGPPSSEAFARALYERIVAVQRDARPEPEAARIDR